jgi:hypothetical protein
MLSSVHGLPDPAMNQNNQSVLLGLGFLRHVKIPSVVGFEIALLAPKALRA